MSDLATNAVIDRLSVGLGLCEPSIDRAPGSERVDVRDGSVGQAVQRLAGVRDDEDPFVLPIRELPYVERGGRT